MIHARKDYARIQDPAGKIPKDEPVFLLRAQDRTATATLMFWIIANESLRDGDPKAIKLAKRHLKRMLAWPVKKTADC
jgi:hypothetical protein